MARILHTLLIVICVLVHAVWSASCPASEYYAVVGGQGFDVSAMRTAINSRGDILVGGVMHKVMASQGNSADIYSGFLYLLQVSDCTVLWKYEFEQLNVLLDPAVAWSHDDSQALMLGYNKASSIITENLIVMKDPYLDDVVNSHAAGNSDVWTTRKTNTESQHQVLDSNTFWGRPSRNYQVFIVSPTELRKAQVSPAKVQWVQQTMPHSLASNIHAVMKGKALFLLADWYDFPEISKVDFGGDELRGLEETYRFQL